MAVNRGARGWQEPYSAPELEAYWHRLGQRHGVNAMERAAKDLPFREPQRSFVDNTAELQAALAQAMAMAQTEARRAVGVVDLVQVNGVWMTPEDAAK